MDDAALDALITETHAEFAANEESNEQQKEPEKVAAEEPAPSEETPEEAKEEPFEGSKKEANALERKRKQLEARDRQIAQKDEENKQLAARLEKLEKLVNPERAANGAPKVLPNGEPNPDAYDDYKEYIRDLGRYDRIQEAAALAPEQPAQPLEQDPERQAWVEQRSVPFKAEIQKDQEAVALLQKYEEVEIPNEIADIFLEMEPQDAIRTFKALAKDGFLADLASMPLAKAALEIGKASLASTPKQTNAPKPLPASRGSVVAEKSFMDMDENASRAWLKS